MAIDNDRILATYKPSGDQSIDEQEGAFDQALGNPPDDIAIDQAEDAARRGDFSTALLLALNSVGDSINLNIGLNASLPLLVPGIKIGAGGGVGVQVLRVADGFELSLDGRSALDLGLEVTDDLNAQIEAGLQAKITYQYETLEEVVDGVRDLAVTGGNHPAADEAAALVETIADILNTVANNELVDFISGAFNGFLGRLILDELGELATDAEDKTNELRNAIDTAKDQLGEARESVQVSGTVGASANLGLPTPFELENLSELGLGAEAKDTFTTVFHDDGTVTVSLSKAAKGIGEAAFAGLGLEGAATGTVTIIQDLQPDDEDFLVTKGGARLRFTLDVAGEGSAGLGLVGEAGTGGQVVFELEVAEVTSELADAVQTFLSGDFEAGLEALGAVEGDVTLQARNTGGFEVGADVGAAGLSFGLQGEFAITDKGELLTFEDVSLAAAIDLFTDNVDDWLIA